MGYNLCTKPKPMIHLHKLPGTRGSFTAKTEKKTKMFSYQVKGTDAEIEAFKNAKEAEGHSVVIDAEFGPLFFSPRNLGRQGVLEIGKDGRIYGFNPDIRTAEEKRGVLSDARVDQLIEEALDSGTYAKKLDTVETES